MTPTQTLLAVAGVIMVPLVVIVGALWRFANKVRDNTTEVAHLVLTVEGTTNALGLNARVRALEDWRTATEAVQRAHAAAVAERQSGQVA